MKSICFDHFRQFWHHSKPGTAKSTFALSLANSHSPQQTTSIWKFLGLLSVFGFFQKIILISAGQDLIRKNASSLIFRKSSFLSWTTPFLDKKQIRVRYSCIAAMPKYCLMQMMMCHVWFSVIWENWHTQIFRLPWINIIVTCADVMKPIQ